jgi:hypothetical protein
MGSVNRVLPALVVAIALGLPSAAAAQPVLTLVGTCPGPMRAEISGTPPRASVWLLYASETGSFTFPWYVTCGGIELGLGRRNLRSVGSVLTDDSGFGVIEGVAGPRACGGYLQALTYKATYPCETTNVLKLE